MDRLRLQGSVIPWPSKIPSHADCRGVSSLLALLADGVLARATLSNHVLVASATVALAA